MPATLADIQAKYGDSVYPLYKDQMHEPYMEADNGIGYKGVVMYDEKEDKVQCSECGKWVKKITNRHLQMHNFDTHKDYKDKFSLDYKTPLCGKSTSNKSRQAALKASLTTEWIAQKESNKEFIKSISSKGAVAKSKKGTTIQESNKIGLCDAQIVSRWYIVQQQIGHIPSSVDLKKYDSQLYYGIIKRHGSLSVASKKFGFTSLAPGQRSTGIYTDIQLIASLRNFVISEKRIPLYKDFYNRKPTYKTIIDRFGSWRRAKMMAGLDQLLEEIK